MKFIGGIEKDTAVMRMLAHDAFDELWKLGGMSRTQAYNWLAKQMNLPSIDAHMRNFTAEQCHQVLALCAKAKSKNIL